MTWASSGIDPVPIAFVVDIDSLTEDTGIASGDFLVYYDTPDGVHYKIDLADFPTAGAHTIASHSDTSATGAELNTLTAGGASNADALHTHTVVALDTTATGAELTELTDGSTTTLHAHASGSTTQVTATVYNGTGSTLSEGKAVYLTGGDVAGVPNVALAQSDSSSTMPAYGIVDADISNASSGTLVLNGNKAGFDTSSWSTGDDLYVDPSTAGDLTTTKPVGANLIQKVCTVTRDNPTLGEVAVFGAGRSNDIPNFTAADKYWYGGTSGVATEGDVTSFARTILDDANAGAARTTLSAAALGANSDITSLAGLTTPLSVAQGGTGVASSTGTTNVVLSGSPTIVTPTIASFANSTHDHADAAGGGTLNASAIAAGTLVHERGGLEADVSAYDGLVKISGGASSAVTAPSGTVVGTTDTQTLTNKDLTAETNKLRHSKSITVEDPSDGDRLVLFMNERAITVLGVSHASLAGTSVLYNLEYATTIASGTVIHTDTCASSTPEWDVTPSGDATIATDQIILLEITTVTGSVTDFHVTLYYDED